MNRPEGVSPAADPTGRVQESRVEQVPADAISPQVRQGLQPGHPFSFVVHEIGRGRDPRRPARTASRLGSGCSAPASSPTVAGRSPMLAWTAETFRWSASVRRLDQQPARSRCRSGNPRRALSSRDARDEVKAGRSVVAVDDNHRLVVDAEALQRADEALDLQHGARQLPALVLVGNLLNPDVRAALVELQRPDALPPDESSWYDSPRPSVVISARNASMMAEYVRALRRAAFRNHSPSL